MQDGIPNPTGTNWPDLPHVPKPLSSFKSLPTISIFFITSGPEVIKKIEMIGNDLKRDNGFGTCGKSGQLVPVGLGIPSCKVLMTVGGSKT